MSRAAKTGNGLTVKQERFVREFLRSGDASAAYRTAYDASHMKPQTVHKRASELLKDGEIAGRLRAVSAKADEGLTYSYEDVIREANEAMEFAREKQDAKAMAALIALKGKFSGLDVEPRKNERAPFAEMTEEELVEGIARDMREAGVTIQ